VCGFQIALFPKGRFPHTQDHYAPIESYSYDSSTGGYSKKPAHKQEGRWVARENFAARAQKVAGVDMTPEISPDAGASGTTTRTWPLQE
jgi:hypothetical protein